MRFRINLTIESSDTPGQTLLPQNYQYDFAMAIQRLILDNKDFYEWLKKTKLLNNEHKFDYYTFSNLSLGNSKIVGDRIQLDSSNLEFYFSTFPFANIEEHIINTFKNQRIVIGDKKSRVEFNFSNIETKPKPNFANSLVFKTISPIIITYRDHTANIYAECMYPKGERFIELFFISLIDKYDIFKPFFSSTYELIKPSDCKFELIGKTQSNSVTIKANSPEETKLRSYFFDFKIQAPIELMEIGYYLGFGEKNSLGFGCCNIIE